MMRSRFNEEKIISNLREKEAGQKTADVCRRHGISDATFYKWKAKYGGLEISDAKRLKGLEDENARLKKLLAEAMLDNAMLKETYGDDEETIGFIQRLLGYALTGTCEEHMLAFCYGTGGNGKGVLLNTVQRIFGSYAATAAVETFTSSTYERHSTDQAMLRGRRLVLAQETDDGQRWAEAKIKRITGGDEITARYMRQDNFTYTPQFTLIIAGNHKPSLRNVDEAIKRRLIMIPFDHTVPADRRDPKLAEALEAEWSGILAWIIEGCLEWQRIGLNPSASIRGATNDYLLEEDALGRFLGERCQPIELFEGNETPTRTIFGDWQEWCATTGEHAGTEKSFSQKLADRGYERAKHPNTRTSMFRRLRLKTTQST